MINLTPLARLYLKRRVAEARTWAYDTENVQRRVLQGLVRSGRHCRWGSHHTFNGVRNYDEFVRQMPMTGYEDIRPHVMRMIDGAENVLWPGYVNRFAQSSGTSGGKSKYIPITEEGLRYNHYAGTRDVLAHYLNIYPDSRIFTGKSMVLGGSYANELNLPADVMVGDLSAHLIDCMPGIAERFRVPSKEIALMKDWNAKLPALVKSIVDENITNISGVPSWFLTVLKSALHYTGASNIHDIWPNLEVFFHGGISFKPYREQYRAITDESRMHYLETYNASEGFFAVQNDPADPAMLLLMDVGVFYEFLPVDALNNPMAEPVPAWKVEPGRNYALIITSCNGLWRYNIGDTVRVESVNPVKITITGRTKSYINAFGEELMVYNADAALANTCARLGCSVDNYTVAPVYATQTTRGRHEWWIEWNIPPRNIDEFRQTLDYFLQRENSDYQAKRRGNLFMDCLTVVNVPRGLFDRWLASTGKLGGQRKVPRLSNDRSIVNSIIEVARSIK